MLITLQEGGRNQSGMPRFPYMGLVCPLRNEMKPQTLAGKLNLTQMSPGFISYFVDAEEFLPKCCIAL